MGKLLVRITDQDGSNPIVLERADDIEEFKTVNSSDEGGKFTIPSNDAKVANINYTKWWEIWDADFNVRLNRGPIFDIEEDDQTWTIGGPGRSQILQDIISTKHTNYYPINRFLDDLRYENLAIEPRTVTAVYGQTGQPDTSNPKYYGLSKSTGPNAIDDTVVATVTDKRLPTFHTTDSYWSGTDKADGITINLGEVGRISRASLLFPWWGGYKRFTNRAYDFDLSYTLNNDSNPFTGVVSVPNNTTVTADTYGGFYFYFRASGDSGPVGYEPLAMPVQDTPINAQYWRVNISATHAWYGNALTDIAPTDNWADQCTPPLVGSGHVPGSIDAKEIKPENDCHASLVEIGLYEEIVGRDTLSNLAYQQIDNASNQITYFHTVGNEEYGQEIKVSTLDSRTLTKYEPGNFFKKVRFSWAGAGSAFTKFFVDDPDNSMTSSVVAVMDQNNSLIYRTTLTSGTKDLLLPAYTQFIQIKGATGVQIINVDTWIGEANAFSVDNTISSSVHAGDTATLHFKGASLQLFVTTPTGKQGGTVRLELATKDPTTGIFGGFSLVADNVAIPNNVSNFKLFEIPLDSNSSFALTDDGIYLFRVTNLGGYVGIDAFAGYWQASWIDFNEDHERILYNDNSGAWVQLYDGRFSGGTMTKSNEFGAHMQFGFEGDRVQIFMAKGPNFGKATIYLSSDQSGYGTNIVPIPGVANSIVIDLGNENDDSSGSAMDHYIPRYLAFDSDNYWPGGMPWALYNIHVRNLDTSTYTAQVNQASKNLFDQPCIDCASEKATNIHKFIYIDGASAHCTSGISVKFDNQTNLDILKSLTQVIEHEWMITDKGLFVRPRIGEDTDWILHGPAVITGSFVRDGSSIATILVSNGAAIDGLPLFTETEDKANRDIMGRTIMRINDFTSVADYFTLIGASRTELFKRRTPDLRVTVSYKESTFTKTPKGTDTAIVSNDLPVNLGDSFMLPTGSNPNGERVRLTKLTNQQSSGSGRTYSLECVKWPQTP